jgi:alkylation response protein AidB-like acyl-CoA dehydrogenase
VTPPAATKGAAWLFDAADPSSVLTPERVSDEHRMIGRTAQEFAVREVVPGINRLEQKDWAFARHLLQRSGELGLLGVDAPEEYGGAGLDKAAALIVSRNLSGSASFSAAFGAQGNLAIVPILLFGTPDQKARYLPKLITGDLVGAYALSESGAGSDALGGTARAARLGDGSFSLDGEKMWITNGGFADLFVVFAKIDGEQFSAFIVERAFAGVSTGAEEHKMGLHGSSTTPLVLQDARVPAANLLGEAGKGHKVAFNVLNFGRFKLGAMCLGGASSAIAEASRYASSRRQFGRPIGTFGAIKQKLGQMTARTYAIEALLYRTAGLIDAAIAQNPAQDAVLAAMEEFAIEASMAKVAGSETLEYVLDENVQIHGGNGFVSDYPAERHYRDARVNRIFEGTNEINRLLIPGMIMKRAAKGMLPLFKAARKLQDDLLSSTPFRGAIADDAGPWTAQERSVEAFKQVSVMTLGLAMQHYGEEIAEQQEILLAIADIVTAAGCAESALLRAMTAPPKHAALHADAAGVFINDAGLLVEASARRVLAAMAEGDTLRVSLAALKRLLKTTPADTIAQCRRLADETIRTGAYIF